MSLHHPVTDLYKAKIVAEYAAIGSYHAFGEGADRDYVVLVRDQEEASGILADYGYTRTQDPNGGSGNGNDHFIAMRKEDINLMVTQDREFFNLSQRAFYVVKVLNLRDKGDRIRVHQLVVDGLQPDEVYQE